MLVAPWGCGPQLVHDFESGERLAAQQQKDLFVYYKSWLSADCGEMQHRLQDPRVRAQLSDKVFCILDEGYEPNRRFASQYGLDGYPGVIVVHRDGTYHSRSGKMAVAQILSFINSSVAPGEPPRVNPQLPRTVEYEWITSSTVAFRLAREQGRRMFIFYKSVISPECNEVIWNVLNRPDVAEQFKDSVNCRLDWGYAPNRKLMAQYGVTDVPGFLIINADGSYRARQGRLSAEELISFARR